MRYYLAHPFESREEVRTWEVGAEKRLGIELVNPFYDVPRNDIKKLDVTKPMTREERQRQMVEAFGPDYYNPIVEGDLHLIATSNGVIAIMNDAVSIGTPMEIFYARVVLQKQVYVVHLTDKNRWHPWLQYYANRMFSGFAEFEKWWSENKL